MSYLALHNQAQDLILSKEGTGRLYYRLGLRYAPTDLSLDALDMGFIVQRAYEAVDDPGDVVKDQDGVWHIKAGARVRVKLTMVADNRRYHVALIDPLPAGLEIVNPALAVSGSIPQDAGSPDYRYGWWWWGPWYEHQNMRDERAEAFTPLLWEGVYDYSYIARATTPGTFVVPPAKAEEMYSPEVFGRSSSDKVIVE
jgi:alpha-2-macroglobulin